MVKKTLVTLCATASLLGCGAEEDAGNASGDDLSSEWEHAYENADDRSDSSNTLGVRVPDQGPFDKRIALTFDDGPNATNTKSVIDTLRAHDLPATFFINSNKVNMGNVHLIVDIASDPKFLLASHTHSHKNMTKLSRSTQESEVDLTTAEIMEAGGEPVFLRFPFGAARRSEMNLIESKGYKSVGWHIDSADWCFAADGGKCTRSTFKHVPDQFRNDMAGLVLSQARAKKGGILLFHDIHSTTASALPGIIERLKGDGFTFVNIDDRSTFPVLNGVPSKFIGDACESSEDCNFPGGFCVTEPEVPGGYCTVGCDKSCPDRAGYPTTRCVDAPDEAGATTRVCTIECAGGCRDGLECRNIDGPRGPQDVCWR